MRVEAILDRNAAAFAAGYRLGYEAGYDHGEYQAEAAMAAEHAKVVATVRALGRDDNWQTRVRAAEAYSRALALRQWSNPRAWESVMNAAPGMAVAVAELIARRP